MKTLLFIIIICLSALIAQAQWSHRIIPAQKHYLYSSGDYITGEKQAGNIGLNYTYNNRYTISIGYTATTKSTVTPGEGFLKSSANLTPVSSAQPFQNTECLHMMVGRVFDLNKKRSIRVILQGGPGISTSREPEFKLQSANQYNFNTTTSKNLSVVLNPKLEMPLFYSIGCSVGPMIIVNGNETFVGAGIGLMYGIIKQL